MEPTIWFDCQSINDPMMNDESIIVTDSTKFVRRIDFDDE